MKAFIFSLVFFISACYAQNNSTSTISINAVKDTSIAADEMVVVISIEKNDTSSTKANQISHGSYVNVLNILEKYGYKKDDIYLITSNFNKNYLRQQGYFTTQTYKIILKKFDLFDQLKKDLIQAGATGVSISNFWISNYDKIKKALYSEAISEAKGKAEYFSSRIGAKSFSFESIMDNSREQSINGDLAYRNNQNVVAQRGLKFSSLGPPSVEPTITNGQINISVSLRITFKYNY